MTETNKLTKSFKTIAIIAIIWNVFGVISYLMHVYMSAETIATLPQYQQDFMNNTPAWRMAAFAIATFGGLIASVLLLMKKKTAVLLFASSFIAIMAGNYYDFFMVNYYNETGISGLILPILIMLIGIFLLWYSKKMSDNGLLK